MRVKRRGWDSNPRYAINAHTLSKRAVILDKKYDIYKKRIKGE